MMNLIQDTTLWKPFDIPKDGEIYRAIDFGVRNPCTLWIYRDREGLFGADDALYVYREYYKTNRTTLENGFEQYDFQKAIQDACSQLQTAPGKMHG